MKILVILFSILILGSCQSPKDNRIVLPALNKESLFPALFNAEAQNEWWVWKPTSAEKDSMNVSISGYCRTRMDTILYYAEGATSKAVVIFGTYRFDEDGMDNCHACAPVLSIAVAQKINSGSWEIIKFIKNFGQHGSWGEMPQYAIARLGKAHFLLEDFSYMGQGVVQTWLTYYHLPTLVGSLEIGGLDDSGLRDDPQTLTILNDSLVDASEGNLTKVVVRTSGVSYEEGKGQITVDSSRVYVLNDSNVFRPAKR